MLTRQGLGSKPSIDSGSNESATVKAKKVARGTKMESFILMLSSCYKIIQCAVLSSGKEDVRRERSEVYTCSCEVLTINPLMWLNLSECQL